MTGLERIAPLTGAAYVVASIVGVSLVAVGVDYLDEPSVIQATLQDNSGRILGGSWLAMVGAVLLLWFSGTLWKTLRAQEGEGGRVSVIAFGGGVVTSGLLLVSNAIYASAAERAGKTGIPAETATGLWDLAGHLWGGGAPVALAAAVGGAALVVLRHGGFPDWWGWLSGALAVALLIVPISWIAFIVAHAWILVLSIWLFVREGRAIRA